MDRALRRPALIRRGIEEGGTTIGRSTVGIACLVVATAACYPDRSVEAGRLRIRAHALTAVGDAPAATACLVELREQHGRPALEAVVELEGPASPEARSMLRGDAGPYRN